MAQNPELSISEMNYWVKLPKILNCTCYLDVISGEQEFTDLSAMWISKASKVSDMQQGWSY